MAAEQTTFEKFSDSNRFKSVMITLAVLFLPGLWQKHMQWDYTNEMTWSSYIGATRNAAAASVISFMSDKPERSRKVISSASGDIPTIGERFTMDKREMRKYLEMKRNPAVSNTEIFKLIYDDLKELHDSVQARLDIMFWEGLSKGEILTNITNNPDGSVDATAVNLGMKATQKFNTQAAVWSNTGTATPVADLKHCIRTYYRPKGMKPTKIYMRDSTFENMVNTDEVKALVLGISIAESGKTVNYAPANMLTLDNVNLILKNQLLPPIEIVDATYSIEKYVDGDPVHVGYEPFDQYNVVLTTNPGKQGRVLYTFSNEELAPEKGKSYAKNQNALFSMFRENGTEVKEIELNAMPVFDNIHGNVLLNTNATDA